MRWEIGQVSLTSLKTRKASVQECNGVEFVYSETEVEKESKKQEDRQRLRKFCRERELHKQH